MTTFLPVKPASLSEGSSTSACGHRTSSKPAVHFLRMVPTRTSLSAFSSMNLGIFSCEEQSCHRVRQRDGFLNLITRNPDHDALDTNTNVEIKPTWTPTCTHRVRQRHGVLALITHVSEQDALVTSTNVVHMPTWTPPPRNSETPPRGSRSLPPPSSPRPRSRWSRHPRCSGTLTNFTTKKNVERTPQSRRSPCPPSQ